MGIGAMGRGWRWGWMAAALGVFCLGGCETVTVPKMEFTGTNSQANPPQPPAHELYRCSAEYRWATPGRRTLAFDVEKVGCFALSYNRSLAVGERFEDSLKNIPLVDSWYIPDGTWKNYDNPQDANLPVVKYPLFGRVTLEDPFAVPHSSANDGYRIQISAVAIDPHSTRIEGELHGFLAQERRVIDVPGVMFGFVVCAYMQIVVWVCPHAAKGAD